MGASHGAAATGAARPCTTLMLAKLTYSTTVATAVTNAGENEALFFGISLVSSWEKADPLLVVNCTYLAFLFFELV